MKKTTITTITIVMSIVSSSARSSENTYALIFTGINKNAKDRQTKDKALVDLRTFLLTDASMKNDRLIMLANSRSLVQNDSQVSSAENLKSKIETLAATVTAKDRFIFYYTGQANIADDKLRLNLPGPDVTHDQLAKWLSQIKTSSMLIVLDCPNAGLAVKTLAEPNRIIIAGCKSKQPYSTRFSEYFVPALSDIKSDSNSDGRISLLEAFTSASKKLDDFYRKMGLLKTEIPMLDDNGDGRASDQPWKYEPNRSDGLAASEFFLLN